MSEVCGRRRLAKLAFVTGVSGRVRGFLEEPVQTTYDYRLTDPFAFHAAFLEERLGAQDSPTVTTNSLKDLFSRGNIMKDKDVVEKLTGKTYDDLEATKPISGVEVSNVVEGLKAMHNIFGLKENDGERRATAQASFMRARCQQEYTDTKEDKSTSEEDEVNKCVLIRVSNFKYNHFSSGMASGEKKDNPILYGYAPKDFKVGAVQLSFMMPSDTMDFLPGAKVQIDPSRKAQLMHTVRAAGVSKLIMPATYEDSPGHIKFISRQEETKSYEKEKPLTEKIDDWESAYVPGKPIELVQGIRAGKDSEATRSLVAGIRANQPVSFSETDIEDTEGDTPRKRIALAVTEHLMGLTDLCEASAGSYDSIKGNDAVADKFLKNAFSNGIRLKLDQTMNPNGGGWDIYIDKNINALHFNAKKLRAQGSSAEDEANVFANLLTEKPDDSLLKPLEEFLVNNGSVDVGDDGNAKNISISDLTGMVYIYQTGKVSVTCGGTHFKDADELKLFQHKLEEWFRSNAYITYPKSGGSVVDFLLNVATELQNNNGFNKMSESTTKKVLSFLVAKCTNKSPQVEVQSVEKKPTEKVTATAKPVRERGATDDTEHPDASDKTVGNGSSPASDTKDTDKGATDKDKVSASGETVASPSAKGEKRSAASKSVSTGDHPRVSKDPRSSGDAANSDGSNEAATAQKDGSTTNTEKPTSAK